MELENLEKVYQLKIRLKDISPMIWRRVLVSSKSSIADLHHTIQILMGWDDDNLHQFSIHGKTLGIPHAGGITFSTNARKVYLEDFKFRKNERFSYEYNFFVHWDHEVRVEKILEPDPKKVYPLCIEGKCASPPLYCHGPSHFMELRDYYSHWRIAEKIVRCYRFLMKEKGEEDDDELLEPEDFIDSENIRETLQTLIYWSDQHKFSCREVNNQLKKHFKEENLSESKPAEVFYEDENSSAHRA